MQLETIQVLLIEDNPLDARFIESLLKDCAKPLFVVTTEGTLANGIERLKQSNYDTVLLDLLLPDGGWPDSLVHLRGHAPLTPIVVLTKLDEETHGLQAVREGAQDYLVKDHLDANQLVRSIRYAIERQRLLGYMLESEERYALAARAAYDGLWDWNLATNEMFYSSRWKSLLGYGHSELARTPEEWFGRIHPDDRAKVMATLQTNQENALPVCECEHRVHHKDGTWRWMLVRATHVSDAKGNPVRLTGTVTDITMRKEAEERLRSSEAYWRSLVANVPDLIVCCDREGKIQYANHLPGGEAPEGALGLSIFDFLPAATRESVRARLATLFETGETQSYETAAPGPGGQQSWYASRMGAIRENNHVTQAIIISSDITERKAGEEALQERNSELAAIVNAFSDLYIWYAPDGTIQEILTNNEEKLYRPISQLIGGRISGLLPDTAAGAIQDAITRCIASGAEEAVEYSLPKPHGLRQYEARMVAVTPGRIFSIIRDITERKLAETALFSQKAILQSVFDNISDGVVTVDTQLQITALNPAAAAIPGLEMSFEAPERWALNFHLTRPDGKSEFAREELPLVRALRGETPTNVEMCIHQKNPPAQQWLTMSARALRDATGRINGAVSILHDITYHKETEEQLKAAHDAALQSARIKAEFLANMSHEIRTPMNAIIGMTGLLLETALTTEQREYSETVRSSADALLALINDILDFSKIEAGKMPVEVHPFQLRGAVESVLELLSEAALGRGVEMASLIHPGVPDQLLGDAGRIRQVLVNLVSNAVKFTKDGTVCVEVTCPAHTAREARLRFVVTDTGIGIAREGQDKLFQAFSQADSSTTRKFGGTGLGLAICRQLVELMHGTIGVDSRLGEGSSFWFELTLQRPTAATATTTPDGSTDGAPLAVRRILLVDIHPLQERVLASIFRNYAALQFDHQAGDPRERLAAEAAAGRPYDLVLLDLRRPTFTALTWAQSLRADRRFDAVNLALLTPYGHRDGGEIARIPKLAVLFKPLRQARLMRLLESAAGASTITGQVSVDTDSPVPVEQAPAREVFRSPQHPDKTLRILLAEDNLINQKVTLRQLEKMGYLADVAANGLEVLDAIKRTPYDVILMDCQMPEMDGYQTTEAIRRRENNQRRTLIIALTAHVMEEDRLKCLAVGMDDYLSKPVRKQDLEGIFQKHFDASARIRSALSRPASIAASDDPIPRRLRDITDGNPALLADLLQLFLRQTHSDLQEMDHAVRGLETRRVEQLAHRCAGSSANYGWDNLSDLFHDLHQASRAGRADRIQASYQKASAEFERIQIRLKEKEG